MAIKGLILQLLLALAFYNCFVSGETDCALPWFGRKAVEKNEANLDFIDKTKYVFDNVCPTPGFGNQNKAYCCYNLRGEVQCCDGYHFIFMGLLILIFIFVLLLMLCCCICCKCRVC